MAAIVDTVKNTIAENFGIAFKYQGVARQEWRDRTMKALSSVGMESFAGHYPALRLGPGLGARRCRGRFDGCRRATIGRCLLGLVFFFGLLFIVEVSLSLAYGVDYRMIEAPYIGRSVSIGPIGISLRLGVPCVVGLLLTLALYLFLAKTFYGKAIMGVSQDSLALRLMGANPIQIKTMAFGLGMATASLAGALLIIIVPIEPSMGREYIGRVFAITVLGGMGSIGGTLAAALILGVAESLTSTFSGPSWALAVSFGILLLALAVRPSGLFGR